MTADQVERRRLAGTVRADDGVTLTLRDAQIEVADDADIAEALFDGADFDGCRAILRYRYAHARYPRSRATVAALSHASAIRPEASRATKPPPTKRTAATIHVTSDCGLKPTPNRLMASPRNSAQPSRWSG